MESAKIIIEIPQYIREVELSKSQRTKFYEWDGETIKAKGKDLLQKYIKDPAAIVDNYGKIKPEFLKDEYGIGVCKGNHTEKIIMHSKHVSPLIQPIVDIMYYDRYNDDIVMSMLLLGKKLRLIDVRTGEQIVANEAQAGTPKWIQIKGQDFYNNKVDKHLRGTIMDAIKADMKKHINIDPIPEDMYPLRITCELHDTVKNVYDRSHDPIGQQWDVDNRCYPYNKAFPDLMQSLQLFINDDRLHITGPPASLFCPIHRHEDRKLVFIMEKDDREIIKTTPAYDSAFRALVKMNKEEKKKPKGTRSRSADIPKIKFSK